MKLAKILLSSTLLFSLQSFGAINPNAIKNELLKKYAGISTRIRRIFAYHYDQIQREVQTMPSRDGNPITRKQKSFINLRY